MRWLDFGVREIRLGIEADAPRPLFREWMQRPVVPMLWAEASQQLRNDFQAKVPRSARHAARHRLGRARLRLGRIRERQRQRRRGGGPKEQER